MPWSAFDRRLSAELKAPDAWHLLDRWQRASSSQ